ncbi:sensor histidine kinase [Cellulomonas rhizosphaerae]|uniref:histidine kinase n=1 Tax=Cellulomonas rhizosphaerae TaxID=2293719 RepID=A0A413RJ78_9CELL|nr:sensor histidine kinase [Cellulomonas rhizosphaerae]RHA38522.1 sensor histidine kinase [Cellulomonas rhizosphaerae]
MNTWDRLLAWEERHRFLVDLVGTLALLLFMVPATIAFGYTSFGSTPSTSLWLTFALLAPLAWRRVSPTLSCAAIYTIALVQMVLVTPIALPADLVVLAALYSVTVHGPRWAHRVAIGGALFGSMVLVGLAARYAAVDRTTAVAAGAFAAILSLAVWAFGLVRRSRRETIEALVDRAERLETERDQQARLATAAERARIAREMHDIVAHSLTVMIAQADGGRYAADADPPAATRALGTIAETGRAALTDMRRLLGVLRDEPRPERGDAPTLGTTTPQPAADDLEALVEQVRASGVRVSMVKMGSPRPLPPGVGLTVYRIAQEALTNVLKHAGPEPVTTVMVQWRPDGITLEVTDDGRGAAADSDGLGQGLRGMAERATMFGGSVTAGPRPGGGFRVRAVIPTPDGSHRPDQQETP